MKTSFSLLLLAVAATSSVRAAECTTDELMSISEIYSSALDTGTSACPDMTTVSDTADYCVSDCLGVMSDMLDSMPDCSSGGVNIKEALQAAIDYCDSGTADTSDIFTDSASSALTSDSSSLFTSDSSGSSALTSDSSSLFTSDSSGSSTGTSSSSGTSLLRTAAPSTADKVTADKQASASASGSSPATALTGVSSVVLVATAFVLATAL